MDFWFRLGDEIGSGNFGIVYHGVWNHIGTKDQVAIKTLHGEASEEDKIKLLKEAATVQQFLHINIIKFYGVITGGERVRNQQNILYSYKVLFIHPCTVDNDCFGVSS